MTDASGDLRLFLVTSGWDGPFQYHQVVVGAAAEDEALRVAEAAFGEVAQPVCRARMRVADLGAPRAGVLAGPARSGEALAAGRDPGARCAPEPTGATAQTPGP